jgi:Polysaccharide biosynthesis protein
VDVTVRSFQSVSLPELSHLQDDRPRFADRITNMINSTALIAFPFLAILAGASEPLVAAIGEEWEAAAAPLSVLCLAGAVTVLTMFTGPVAMAVGKPHLLALVTWVSAAMSTASFVVAGFLLMEAPVEDQVLGIAVARVALFSTAGLALAGWVILRNSDNSLLSLVKAVTPATLVSAMAFSVTRLLAGLTWPGGDIIRLLLVLTASTIITAALLMRIEPRFRTRVARVVRKVARHRSSRLRT